MPAWSSQVPTITSVVPSTWSAGQTFSVLVTGVFPGDASPTVMPGCSYTEVTVQSPQGDSYSYIPGGSDTTAIQSVSGGITISDIVWVSSSQTSFTITIAPGTASETVDLSVSCDRCECEPPVPVQIVGCPPPTITAVSPSIWFAGKTYDNVKITGTGFTTTDKATASCPATTVTIAAADGSAVPIGNVNVDSKTKITLTGVAPPASDPTQSATVTAGTSPNTGTFNTAQILGNQIKCAASMANCGGSVISTADGSDPLRKT